MDVELVELLARANWEAVRTLLLEQNRESRASVGLGAASPLSALQLAALHDAELAQHLIGCGLPVEAHSAAALGRLDDLRHFPAQYGDLAEHLTPMGFALLKGRLDSVQTLLDAGDDPNRPLPRIGFFVWELQMLGVGAWSPLHMASAHGYHANAAAIAQALVDGGADLSARCPLGETALHLAATFGWRPIMERLLAAGADVDDPTEPMHSTVRELCSPKHAAAAHLQTPLMIAAREGGVETARFLIDHGANIQAQDSNGATALHIAARPWWKENAELVATLLAAGADKHIRDNRGRTPFDIAKDAGFAQSAAALAS